LVPGAAFNTFGVKRLFSLWTSRTKLQPHETEAPNLELAGTLSDKLKHVGQCPTNFSLSTSRTKLKPPSLTYSLISNFSCGNIARMPLCCQQRTGPCTRREQGVPFLVRAPQV